MKRFWVVVSLNLRLTHFRHKRTSGARLDNATKAFAFHPD